MRADALSQAGLDEQVREGDAHAEQENSTGDLLLLLGVVSRPWGQVRELRPGMWSCKNTAIIQGAEMLQGNTGRKCMFAVGSRLFLDVDRAHCKKRFFMLCCVEVSAFLLSHNIIE